MSNTNNLESRTHATQIYSPKKYIQREQKPFNCCAYGCGCGCLTLISIPIIAYTLYQLLIR